MLLCADIGNSHTTIGLVEDGVVHDHWRVATEERRTADEWGILLKALLADSSVKAAHAGVAVAAPGGDVGQGHVPGRRNGFAHFQRGP